jgi:ribosomal protein L24
MLWSKKMKDYFYESETWSKMRYRVLKRDNFACLCCGSSRINGVTLHVDHIKPRSKYPELELDYSNLQTLCANCNIGKSNLYEDNFFTEKTKKIKVKKSQKRHYAAVRLCNYIKKKIEKNICGSHQSFFNIQNLLYQIESQRLDGKKKQIARETKSTENCWYE